MLKTIFLLWRVLMNAEDKLQYGKFLASELENLFLTFNYFRLKVRKLKKSEENNYNAKAIVVQDDIIRAAIFGDVKARDYIQKRMLNELLVPFKAEAGAILTLKRDKANPTQAVFSNKKFCCLTQEFKLPDIDYPNTTSIEVGFVPKKGVK